MFSQKSELQRRWVTDHSIFLLLARLFCQQGFRLLEACAQQPSNILFSDDFSSTKSGWDQVQEDDMVTDYANGGYRIYVNEVNYDMWANPSKFFPGDVRIEVDATKIGGPDDNDFGVICRYQDIDNFYFFMISSDGYAAIGKFEGSNNELISSDNMQKVDGITPGAATNHIRADCIGSELKLYVNGNLVATATDSSFTSGDVGLMAGTYDTAGTDSCSTTSTCTSRKLAFTPT